MEFLDKLLHRQKNNKLQRFGSPDAPYVGHKVDLSSYFNEDKAKSEALQLNFEGALANLRIFPMDNMTKDEKNKWTKINLDMLNGLTAGLKSLEKNLKPEEEPTNLKISLKSLRLLTTLAKANSQLEEVETFASKRGFLDKVEKDINVIKLFAIGELTLKIEGVNLNDLITSNNYSSSELFKYFIDCVQIDQGEKFIDPPKSDLYDTAPNYSRLLITEQARSVINAMNLTQENLKSIPFDPQDPKRTFIKRGSKIIDTLAEKRQKVFGEITKGNDHELNSFMQKFLDKDDVSKINVLLILGVNNPEKIVELYRSCRKQILAENDVNFYYSLQDAIDVLIESFPDSNGLPTVDEIETIFDEEQGGQIAQPTTIEDLDKIIPQIFSKSSNLIYNPDPESVQWLNIATPSAVRVEFDKNRPKKFEIELNFQNENGESITPLFKFDTTKGKFDWSFLESPEDPAALAFRNNILAVSKTLLEKIKKEAEESYLQKRNHVQIIIPQEPKKPKIRPQRAESVEERAENENKATAIMNTVVEKAKENRWQEKSIKRVVQLPEGDSYKKLTSRLSHEDQNIVKDAIEEFNTRGTGASFKMLKSIGLQGERLYQLRISSKVPKGVRVLMSEAQSTNGERIFRVIAIDYRKDVYRKNKL